jgi:RNA polymerase sigma-70 factor (ECF subfamily)
MDGEQERDVARRLRDGKPEAWHTLYEAYAERVWRSVARLMGPVPADVADVVQETFLAAARSAATYDSTKGSLWLWLWGIARRQVALSYRKQARHDRLKSANAWLAVSNGRLRHWLAEGTGETPGDTLEAAELATLVRSTLTELPDDYEWLLTARYLDDISVEELAGQERSTASAIRSKLARARAAFRQAFGKYLSFAPERKP